MTNDYQKAFVLIRSHFQKSLGNFDGRRRRGDIDDNSDDYDNDDNNYNDEDDDDDDVPHVIYETPV